VICARLIGMWMNECCHFNLASILGNSSTHHRLSAPNSRPLSSARCHILHGYPALTQSSHSQSSMSLPTPRRSCSSRSSARSVVSESPPRSYRMRWLSGPSSRTSNASPLTVHVTNGGCALQSWIWAGPSPPLDCGGSISLKWSAGSREWALNRRSVSMSGMCEDGIGRVVNGPCYVWKAFVLEWGCF
jgi:hypothetical protein